jgi:hypothetical protein
MEGRTVSGSDATPGFDADSRLTGGGAATLVVDVNEEGAAAIAEAIRFVGLVEEFDRSARRQQRTLPTEHERHAIRDQFWQRLLPELARLDEELPSAELARTRQRVQTVLNPWLLRSRLWARSWLKPHGFAGDYRMVEWMYDLEQDPCASADQPAIVNLLDDLFRSVHSVQAVWHRRAWFARLIASYACTGQPARVLDVASGGSRYMRDVIESHGSHAVEPTLFDQDPAALAFVGTWMPSDAAHRTVCAPVSRLPQVLPAPSSADDAPFDVVISTGLFDYLPAEPARELLAHMIALTRPGGTVAICNFSAEDPSRSVKDWVAAWPLIYRGDSELADLFPSGLRPELSRSSDGGLLYAQLSIGMTRGRSVRGA